MNLQVLYCTHQTAELSVRERLAFSSADVLGRAYSRLRHRFPESEVVLLSTCNRVEMYAAQENADNAPTARELAEFMAEFHSVPIREFFDDLLERTGPEAVRHLFQVASSIDSMVLGEPQIVNQVKEAYRLSQEYKACGTLTHSLFQRAIRVSARVRTETGLSEGRISVASVAVGEFAKGIFDRFDDKMVLVIGSGEMAEESLRYLKDEGVRDLVVVNRGFERGSELAQRWGGRAEPFESLDSWIAQADVIVSATGAQTPIVDARRFSAARKGREDKPIFVLDLGTPRDIDPAVARVDENVFLFDIDSLEATCEANRKTRAKQIERAQQMIDEETERFMSEVYHRATGPIIKRLRDQWHGQIGEELDRLFAKLPDLEPIEREHIERSFERVVNKLLHPPLETLRDEARDGTPHGLVDALRRLFHLRD